MRFFWQACVVLIGVLVLRGPTEARTHDLRDWVGAAADLMSCENSMSHNDLSDVVRVVASATGVRALRKILKEISLKFEDLEDTERRYYANPYRHLAAREEARSLGVERFGTQWVRKAQESSQQKDVSLDNEALMQIYATFIGHDLVRAHYEKIMDQNRLVRSRLELKKHFLSVALEGDEIDDWEHVHDLLLIYKKEAEEREKIYQTAELDYKNLYNEVVRLILKFPKLCLNTRPICGNYLSLVL